MQVNVQQRVTTAVEPSQRVLEVAAMFGLGLDEQRSAVILPPVTLTLAPGRLIFITGASGGGKSTLLRLVADAAKGQPEVAAVISLADAADLPDRPLVDLLPDWPLEPVLKLYARAGLNDAFVLLRRPTQLSDGQRYRLRLALAMAKVRDLGPLPPSRFALVLADELGATLDRITAAVLARNLRKWVTRSPVCLLAATTHDDLLEPLQPDTVVDKGLGSAIEVAEHPGA